MHAYLELELTAVVNSDHTRPIPIKGGKPHAQAHPVRFHVSSHPGSADRSGLGRRYRTDPVSPSSDIPSKGGMQQMRKLIASIFLSVLILALQVAPALAGDIGPTP